ncbi:putative protein kinase RLK-Pelle-WAK family [Helianthus annuus]|nr:putative protein kinase RLK-Pelle-WAK family [Helianthus annuus]KAJ0698804.1 putative protein kinase RLK-Pelle-WAK family [Helianthus annuus]KAJ0877708.1 putative protein kinase RLK-Pelle-WAK family [Helianthus annuus]KAJ0882058.1 putative protein kinase RLK-Pelle-WAK family [Helianthus annuus]
MLLQINVILMVILTTTKAASHVAQSLPGCPDNCGNITIPYPFGIGKECSLSETYEVNCTTLRVAYANFKLFNISLDDGLMHGLLPMAYHCYNSRGSVSWSQPKIRLSRFRISSKLNLLTTVGCSTRANLMDMDGKRDITGCKSRSSCKSLVNGTCSGKGCMQIPIPYLPQEFRIQGQRVTRKVGNWSFNNCTYGFLAYKDQYRFQETDLDNMKNRSFLVALEWSIGNTSCKEAKKNKTSYICKENSVCVDFNSDFDRDPGYNCHCAQGFKGNPYLTDGCQGFGTGPAASVLLTLILCWGLKQRRTIKSREMFFTKNGGLILQKILFESKQPSNMAKIFAARILEKATNNFHKTNVIGQGGYGTVYKGKLEDDTMVAIKKSKSIDESQIEQFINEVIMLSEVSHPNIVKLLGCCLETQTPLLVYEFVTNKTVFHHIHEKNYTSSMTFERRLNIATQTAKALAHMHSTTQIIHRDIKSSNILLTDDYTVKVSDFGISRFIPANQTHIQTLVHGTLGYIDPEYFRSGILTEKSDVYSFGMFLVELITGRKVFSHDGTESDLGLAMFFVISLERGCLIQILHDQVKKDGISDHIDYIAKIAKDCIELEGKKRPTMEAVKKKLEQLRESFIKSCPGEPWSYSLV